MLLSNAYFDLRTAVMRFQIMQLHLQEMCYYLLKTLFRDNYTIIIEFSNKTV